jgi:hypothetical protein
MNFGSYRFGFKINLVNLIIGSAQIISNLWKTQNTDLTAQERQ